MYKVEVKNTGDSKFNIKSEHGEFVVDSEGSGSVTPLEAFLSSLGCCVGVYIRKYAKGINIPIDYFTVGLEAELSKKSPIGFNDIKVTIDLKGSVDDMKKHSLQQFVQNCPVHNTLKGGPNIEINVM